MTNQNCLKCNTYNAEYRVLTESEGCYMCIDCGHAWGGFLAGNTLNKAYYLARRAILEMDAARTKDYNPEMIEARDIALDNLESIARALKINQQLRKLPNTAQWWLQHQFDIEAQLMAIESIDLGGADT